REIEAEFEGKLAKAREEFEAKLEELKATYPRIIARRLAEGLVKHGTGNRTVADLLKTAESTPGLEPIGADVAGMPMGPSGSNGGSAAAAGDGGGVAVAEEEPESVVETAEPEPEVEEDDALAMEPFIETARCTTCDECTNLNNRMFKYDENKQAYIADATAGTFRELVMAAERCPAGIIHPGDPLNENEKDLDKWVKRAEPFN
ncbi:MAG: ferredoxin, partial [Longimicrobiales bacterium]|nr:ferredoxin [Longimicrobiales bacterium]